MLATEDEAGVIDLVDPVPVLITDVVLFDGYGGVLDDLDVDASVDDELDSVTDVLGALLHHCQNQLEVFFSSRCLDLP